MNRTKPRVVILSSKFDLSCDYVVSKLRENSVGYLRINSEDLPNAKISIDPEDAQISFSLDSLKSYLRKPETQSVYFRRPVYQRDLRQRDSLAQFAKNQWAVFLCNFMILDDLRWMNHPRSTYYAEHKAVQLRSAVESGFSIPNTLISNFLPDAGQGVSKRYAIKGLDTVLFSDKGREHFGFTTSIDHSDLTHEDLSEVPITLQEWLEPKLDIRVTVVGNQAFSVSIQRNSEPVSGDWRSSKEDLEYSPIDLPTKVHERCIELTKILGLSFSAIDLAYSKGKYYFLEINPTGEWAWLVDHAEQRIDAAIASWLSQPTGAV